MNIKKEEFIEKYDELKSSRKMAEYFGTTRKNIIECAKIYNYDVSKYSNKKFNPDKDEFIKNYDRLKSSRKMSDLYNVCKKCILDFAKEIDYFNDYLNCLDEQQIKYVCSQYYKKSAREVSLELGVSKSLISKVWAENNLKGKDNRTYYSNFDYFENLDSKDKAYFIGLLMADGCIYHRKNNEKTQGWVRLSLKQNDIEILDTFKKYTNSNNPINTTVHKHNLTSTTMSTLTFVSDKMCNDLIKYGIHDRKTSDAEFMNISNEYIMHFIRGYFDGDGCISKGYERQKWVKYHISFSGNYNNINKIKSVLDKIGVSNSMYKDNREDKYSEGYSNYNLSITKQSCLISFINILYADSDDLKLSRKYNKCIEAVSIYKEKGVIPTHLDIHNIL